MRDPSDKSNVASRRPAQSPRFVARSPKRPSRAAANGGDTGGERGQTPLVVPADPSSRRPLIAENPTDFARRWWTNLSEGSYTPPAEAARWYVIGHRWAPVVAPLLGILMFLIAAFFATPRGGARVALVSHGSLVALFVLYLFFGALYGALLYLAPSATLWWCFLVGGAVVYLVSLCMALAGWSGFLVGALLVALAALLYWRQRGYVTPEGELRVTTLANVPTRMLQPGPTLLLPGERVEATLSASPREVDVPTQRIQLANAQGEVYEARAAARLAYVIAPETPQDASRASAPGSLDGRIREAARASLRGCLDEWANVTLAATETPPEGALARATLHVLRQRAQALGAHLLWVNVRDIWLAPASEMTGAPEGAETAASDAPGMAPAHFAAIADEGQRAATRSTDEVDHTATETAEDADDSNDSNDADGRSREVANSRWLLAGPPITPAPVARPVAAAPLRAGASPPPPTPIRPVTRRDETPPDARDAGEEQGSEELDVHELSPDALSDAYEAVRQGHVNDPETIRQVARAFQRVAEDDDLNADFPYDAQAAATILLDRAREIEQAR